MRKGSTILITGATSGIGRHAALYLARRGHRVFAGGRRVDSLNELARNAGNCRLETIMLDVTQADSISAAKDEVEKATDGYGLDALVNNAGYGEFGPIEMISESRLRKQFDTNVFGLLAVIRAFAPAMRARGSGRIVNVGSVGGGVTFPVLGAYHATKYAVEALSDALRNEMKYFSVDVILVEPGPIRTDLFDAAMQCAAEEYCRQDAPYQGPVRDLNRPRRLIKLLSCGPECVSRAIERALCDKRPKARYYVPLASTTFLRLLGFLPQSLRDSITRKIMGISCRK
jgi:short-subunit dehydrogenase